MITVFYSHVIDAVNQTGKSFEEIVKTINKAGIDALMQLMLKKQSQPLKEELCSVLQ